MRGSGGGKEDRAAGGLHVWGRRSMHCQGCFAQWVHILVLPRIPLLPMPPCFVSRSSGCLRVGNAQLPRFCSRSRSRLCQYPPPGCWLGPGKAAAAEGRRLLPDGGDETPGAGGGAVAGEGNTRRFVVISRRIVRNISICFRVTSWRWKVEQELRKREKESASRRGGGRRRRRRSRSLELEKGSGDRV